jgi:hypothetical protein
MTVGVGSDAPGSDHLGALRYFRRCTGVQWTIFHVGGVPSGSMEFTDYMLWKALAIVVLAFLAGLFGFIRPQRGGKNERPPE